MIPAAAPGLPTTTGLLVTSNAALPSAAGDNGGFGTNTTFSTLLAADGTPPVTGVETLQVLLPNAAMAESGPVRAAPGGNEVGKSGVPNGNILPCSGNTDGDHTFDGNIVEEASEGTAPALSADVQWSHLLQTAIFLAPALPDRPASQPEAAAVQGTGNAQAGQPGAATAPPAMAGTFARLDGTATAIARRNVTSTRIASEAAVTAGVAPAPRAPNIVLAPVEIIPASARPGSATSLIPASHTPVEAPAAVPVATTFEATVDLAATLGSSDPHIEPGALREGAPLPRSTARRDMAVAVEPLHAMARQASKAGCTADNLSAATPDGLPAAGLPVEIGTPLPGLALPGLALPGLAPAVSTASPSPSAPAPQDFATLMARLGEAREAAAPAIVRTALSHHEFGSVTLQFRHEEHGLSVTMASADPAFAGAVQSAATSLPANAPPAGEREQPRDGAASQQHGTSHAQAQAQGQAQAGQQNGNGNARQDPRAADAGRPGPSAGSGSEIEDAPTPSRSMRDGPRPGSGIYA